jgi:Ribbon-helix-helix protein, copG family
VDFGRNVRCVRREPGSTLLRVAHGMEFAVKKRKPLHAASVHLDDDVWRRVEQLARDEKRPISNLLRVLVADAIANRSGRSAPAGTSAAAAA